METARFTHPLLSGIRAPTIQVKKLEMLAHYLEGRVSRGDYLLAFDDAPDVYYLTQTRPAIDHAWSSVVIPPDVKKRSLRKMVATGRVPQYAVHHRWYTPTNRQGKWQQPLVDGARRRAARQNPFPQRP